MTTQNVVILTGAGISAESGIKTFRDSGGLWENHKIEDVATPEGFAKNPRLVNDFYNARRNQLKTAEPNNAHKALARMEKAWKGDFLLVTQNVDDLHERAGSGFTSTPENPAFLHMHGELKKIRCQESNRVYSWESDLLEENTCECCNLRGSLRPHIVWFGEMPLYMDYIYSRLQNADIFIAIGTSGNVYPAAGFVHEARASGAHTIEMNLVLAETGNLFAKRIEGPASLTVSQLVEDYLK